MYCWPKSQYFEDKEDITATEKRTVHLLHLLLCKQPVFKMFFFLLLMLHFETNSPIFIQIVNMTPE